MWKPIDTEFYVPLLPVAVASIDNDRSDFLRSMLEALGCVVLLHAIGTPSDFLKVIAQGASAPRYLFVMGHGTEDGLYFGEYGAQIDTSMLHNHCLPPAIIQQHANLPGCTVIGGFCLAGAPAMAEAFLKGNLSAYIGCRDYPDASALNVFLINFVFGVLGKKLADRDAWQHAVEATEHTDIDQISYYHGDGTEERIRTSKPG